MTSPSRTTTDVRPPGASYVHHMEQTRVRPDAFRHATAVRSVGIGMTGLASVLSGAALVALLMIISVAVTLTDGVGPFVPALAVATLLGGYVAVMPPWFAQATRATTASVTGARLVAALAGYAALWAVLVTVV